MDADHAAAAHHDAVDEVLQGVAAIALGVSAVGDRDGEEKEGCGVGLARTAHAVDGGRAICLGG